ncbi:unnamed protein product [Ambrosiozyma monospora]|uniref:Unnamed protein product n=1 Tax=Ambrosiozyma monospora TaxID=43982 RepID=A0A9W6Z7I1_AMBMO|nr:unnamed protein product [Ambrosiozyma monospora]
MKNRQSLDCAMKHFEMLLSAYINLPQQRLFAKNFLGDCVLRVTGDDEAWYEPDPTAIFKALLTKAEINGEISLKSMDDLKTQDPIDDPETRNQFVQNLTGLREAVFDITKRIERSIEGLPLFIRCVCKEIYLQLKKEYPGEPERFYLSSIGTIFIKSYITPMFITPENYGVHLSSLNDPELARNNLLEVAKVLNQLVLMRPFGSSNAFLQPLNPFLEEFIEGIREILKDLIDIEMIDECYQMSVYDDVSSNVKPMLRLSTDEILEVLELIKNEIDITAPEKNNLLRYIMLEINELVGSTHNKLGKGMIDLKLEPVAESSDSHDVEMKALLLEAKRYIIYILQIQNGEDLLDLLLSEITPTDEFKFRELAKAERKRLSSSNVESAFEKEALNEIFNSTFPQVKKRAIELILSLERMGALTRNDGYQELLNDIAFDIKTVKSQKEERDRQFRVVIDTLTKLKQKERTCAKVYNSYINDIDNAMFKLQRRKDIYPSLDTVDTHLNT